MTEEKRYKKYVEEHCSRCKNRDKFDCEIRIHNTGDTIITKCDYYEKED